MKRNSFLFKFIGFLFVSALTISGCKENGIVESVPVGYTSYEDAAETIPAAVADTTCGIIDIIGDISEFATIEATNSRSTSTETFTTTFTDSVKINDTTWIQKHTWRGILARTKSDTTHFCYSTITRTYEWIYYYTPPVGEERSILNYIVGPDTATRIALNILSGTGYAITPQIHQNVYSVTGTWAISNTNTDTISMVGNICQSAFDTLLRRNILRTVNGQMGVFSAIKANRLQGRTSISIPLISGSYIVDLAFPRGQQQYADVTFTRNFFVRFNTGADDDINIGGMIWHGDAMVGTVN